MDTEFLRDTSGIIHFSRKEGHPPVRVMEESFLPSVVSAELGAVAGEAQVVGEVQVVELQEQAVELQEQAVERGSGR